MTKETKIGLLVGLAFIVLFAIILSEKGATPGTQVPSGLTMADAVPESEAVPNAQSPLHNAGKLPVHTQQPPLAGSKRVIAEAPLTEEPVGQFVPQDGSKIPLLPESVVALLNTPVVDEEKQDQDTNTETALGSTPLTLAQAVADARKNQEELVGPLAELATPPGPGATKASLLDRADPFSTKVARKTTPTNILPDKPAKSQKPRLAIKAIHVVKPGESLGKVAAKHYGRSTPARIQAVFDANRGILKNVHDIRPDMKLNIPDLDKVGEVFVSAPNLAAGSVVAAANRERKDTQVRIPLPVDNRTRTSAPSPRTRRNAPGDPSASATTLANAKSPGFRWYEVRKSDSLAKIARQELGNEKRFLEIYRLNRDRIPNRDQIKPGMKIRLPSKTVASARSSLDLGF